MVDAVQSELVSPSSFLCVYVKFLKEFGLCNKILQKKRLLLQFYFLFEVEGYPTTVNPLTPNDPYSGRTAPLNSKRFILYIYSTNIGAEYFKHRIYSPFFVLFKMQFVS